MDTPRRILIATPSLPYPPIWGFGTRVYQLARHLTPRHEVHLLTFATPDDPATDDRVASLRAAGLHVHTVPFEQPEGAINRRDQLRSLLSPRSYSLSRLRSRALQQAADRLLATRFDLVQVESSPMRVFEVRADVPVVLDEHNIEYELLYRVFRTDRSPARRLFNLLEFVKFRREEIAAWREMSGVVFTSEREQRIVRNRYPHVHSTVAPNGVDVDYFSPTRAQEPLDPHSIVFTGMLRYRPNTDGVLWFVREVLPLVLREQPEAVLSIVGTGVPPEIEALDGPHVVVTGTVPDVRPYLARAAVTVVPLRMGSGTRLKVLEGLAMQRPMVSTTVGCEGIAVRSGEHLLGADDAPAFAGAVVDLLRDPARAACLGRAGRALVEQTYSWQPIAQHLEAFHAEVIRAYRASGTP